MLNKINLDELIKDIQNGEYDDMKYSLKDTTEETLEAMINNGVIDDFIQNKTYQKGGFKNE